VTDGQGLVESIITTPANCADTVVLPELIEKAELTQAISVLADKGYCSKKNSACLLEKGLIDGIMLKAQKGMKLTERQRELNNAISKMRCLTEGGFQEGDVVTEGLSERIHRISWKLWHTI